MPPQGPPVPASYVIVMVMFVMIIWLVAQLPTFAVLPGRDIIIAPPREPGQKQWQWLIGPPKMANKHSPGT